MIFYDYLVLWDYAGFVSHLELISDLMTLGYGGLHLPNVVVKTGSPLASVP